MRAGPGGPGGLVGGILLLLGCTEGSNPVPCEGSRCSSQEIRILSEVQSAPAIDLVIVVDDSPSLAARQGRLRDQLVRTFEQSFGSLRTSVLRVLGDFDLEVRVISTTTRVGDGSLPGCAAAPAPDCPLPVGGVWRWNKFCGGPGPNFEGTLEGAIGCAARLPGPGCAVEQPLAALAAHLERGPALRPSAELVVLIVTEEDDCSFEGAPPFSVDEAAAIADAPELSERCRDADEAGALTPVSRYVELLGGLKTSGAGVHVSVIVGPSDPAEAPARSGRGLCYGQDETAQAAPRLWRLARSMPDGGTVSSFCSDDWGTALERFGARFPILLGDRCVPVPLLDVDPATPGLQPDCSLDERVGRGGGGRTLPSCTSAAPPCWSVVPDAACGRGYRFDVQRDSCVAPRGTVLDLRCAADPQPGAAASR